MNMNLFAVVLSLFLLCTNAAKGGCNNLRLQGSKFKILQISDLEYTNGDETKCKNMGYFDSGCTEKRGIEFISKVIETEKPNLIVYSGDNVVAGMKSVQKSLEQAFSPAIESGLPWCAILGNHDNEDTINRREMMEMIAEMPGSCSVVSIDGVHGIGNFDFVIRNSSNSPVAHLFFLDTGEGHNKIGGYDWIQASQIDWLRSRAKEVQSNISYAVSILIFTHIPIPEFASLLQAEDGALLVGSYQEKVWHSGINGGLYSASIDLGRVKGIFAGHDHLNDYCVTDPHTNVSLCYAGSAGYGAYSQSGWGRRVRIIEVVQKDGIIQSRTWKRVDNINGMVDPQILGTVSSKTLWVYNEMKKEWVIVMWISVGFAIGCVISFLVLKRRFIRKRLPSFSTISSWLSSRKKYSTSEKFL